jgi:hypothetical protein
LGIDYTGKDNLRASQQYKSMLRDAGTVMEFIREACPHNLVEQRALLSLGVELLYRDLTTRNIPCSSRVLLAQMFRLPATFSKHFPGYARHGILGLVVGMNKLVEPANGGAN